MSNPGLTAVVSRARLAAVHAMESRSDGGLLTAFLATGDTDAFAELVARFGPMVFAVCRRVSRHRQDAEDAFQATFVVLARKAASIAPREGVGNWLYGVAIRTAREARVMAAKRHAREVLIANPPAAARPDPALDDLDAVLHEELAELSDKFRTLLVLCDLRGEPQTEVAERLGLPVGTVYSRLAKARTLLADRLRKRGVALSAVGLVTALGATGRAVMPAGLPLKAVAVALSPDSVPAAVAGLTNGVLRIMFLDKLKTVVLLCAVSLGPVACAALAAGLSQPGTDTPRPPKVAPLVLFPTSEPIQVKAEAKPVSIGPNKILFFRSGHLALIDPDGKNEKHVSRNPNLYHPSGARLSPDGKMIAAPVLDPLPIDDGIPGAKLRTATLHIRGLDEKEPGTNLGVTCMACVWSPDGTEIACSQILDGPDQKPDGTNVIVNVKTKEKTALKLPVGHVITDWSRDGKSFVTMKIERMAGRPSASIHLMNRDGSESKALSAKDAIGLFGLLAPDGKRVLYLLMEEKEETPMEKKARQEAGGRSPRPTQVLAVLDVATGKATPVADVPLNAEIQAYCWSPDGKRIAYTWRQVHEGKPENNRDRETESHLVVCDLNGKNQKTIATEKGFDPATVTLGGVDWR